MTRSIVQVCAGNRTDAFLSLVDAVAIARVSNDEEMAQKFVREFETAYAANIVASPAAETAITINDDLRLVLPPSLAHHADFQGVWINNSHLEKSGLRKGMLAVVVKEKVGRGQLAAVAEITTGEISCGFYDSEFGLISLDSGGADPVLFVDDDVTVLGRIVGYCDPADETDGKMTVVPLA